MALACDERPPVDHRPRAAIVRHFQGRERYENTWTSEPWAVDTEARTELFLALRPTLAEATEHDLKEALDNISSLVAMGEGRGGNNGTLPSDETTGSARCWLVALHTETHRSPYAWSTPHVTASPDGEVVLEWWQGEKKLTVYILGESATYVKVSGPDIYHDMNEGPADTPEERAAIWRWLMG